VIRVERNLQRVGREWVETTPKTASGRRVVHVGADAVRALDRQRALVEQWRLRAGPLWQERDRVFSNRTGGPLNARIANRVLAEACDRVLVPVISMHALRHLHASLALQAGAPIALVSRQLGHAHVGITMQLYSHALTDGRKVAEALARALASNRAG
jgi:integrase